MSEKAIFLDRDDTLIEDPGYINSVEQVKLLDGVGEALCELRSLGFKLVVATNQSGVARGIITEKTLVAIHDRLEQLLAQKDAHLDSIHYCPYHPEGAIPRYRKESELRKPNPGMLLKAAEQMDINLEDSWSIGNSSRDIEAGKRAGCKTILIDSSREKTQSQRNEPEPDFRAVNLKEAVNIIKKQLRSSVKETDTEPETEFQSRQAANQLQTSMPQQLRQPPSDMHPDIEQEDIKNLLISILEQLKKLRRNEMFEEFSITRVLAGIVQVVVLFCLLISVWFLMSPTRQYNSVLISLGFAAVFQAMALTLYIMQRQK